jgi:hypothetical protein
LNAFAETANQRAAAASFISIREGIFLNGA